MSKAGEPAYDPTPQEGAEAASAWFVRRRSQRRGVEELEFTDWLEADPANKRAYDDVTRSWELVGDAASDPDLIAMRSEALMMRPLHRSRWSVRAMSVAATAIAIVGTGLSYQHLRGANQPTEVAAVSPRIIQTSVGERSTVTLDDGSIVTLDTNSKLAVNFTAEKRSVALLDGQVFFQVAHNKTRPFVVTAANRQVVAVGTEFSVRLGKEGVKVALLEGKVQVYSVPRPDAKTSDRLDPTTVLATLEPGDQLVAASSGQVSVKQANIEALTGWREGRVRFDDTPLSEAVAEINRYSNTPIVIADGRAAAIHISGTFRTGQPLSFAQGVSSAFPVRFEVSSDHIQLKSAI